MGLVEKTANAPSSTSTSTDPAKPSEKQKEKEKEKEADKESMQARHHSALLEVLARELQVDVECIHDFEL